MPIHRRRSFPADRCTSNAVSEMENICSDDGGANVNSADVFFPVWVRLGRKRLTEVLNN
jgi:hypothetical protein